MLLIREMLKKDLKFVLQVEEECFTMPWTMSDFEEEIKNPSAVYLVAELDGVVVGFSGLWNILNEGNITNIAIKKEYQSQGIGTKLLEALINHSAKMGMVALTLEVRVSNLSAQHLYKKLGFEQAGIRKDFYQYPKEDAIIMWNNINVNKEIVQNSL